MGQTLEIVKPLPVTQEIHYPETDGQPMGETAFHLLAIMYLLNALRYYYRAATDMYVGSNMLMYYEKDDNSVFVVPDVFITKNTSTEERRVWKTWVDGVPAVIFEMTSRSTRLQDIATKRGLYELLGVREYILFDPLDEYLEPQLQGFRLVGDEFQRIALEPNGDLFSAELGLFLRRDGKLLRAVDPNSLTPLPTLQEAMELAEQELLRAETEAQRAETEAQRANKAEQEVQRLRAEVERLRGEAQGD